MSKEGINLFALSLEQLNQLKSSIEEELQGLQGALQQLQISRNKLTTSKEALSRLSQTPEGTPMLVPITSSLYVPGETAQLDTIIVDVGTGARASRFCLEPPPSCGRSRRPE
jgi:prefoldin alpha subunit